MAKVKEVNKDEEFDQIEALLNDERFKGTHFNGIEKQDWLLSTGSLSLDYALSIDGKQGIGPQIFNIFADFGQGKSSFLYNLGARFQRLGPEYFTFIVSSEGRTNDELLRRSGIDTNPNQFFKLDCNVAESVFGIIRELCQNNPKKRKYFFIIDSMDALARYDDQAKDFKEANKVAGNALLSKTFFKTISLNISAGSHFLGIISQVITNINTSGYGGTKTVPAGGKGIAFFSSTIIEIKPTWTETIIWENPSGSSLKDKGKRLGHYFQAHIVKHVKDQVVGQIINVPIKHGAEPGKAVWQEIEFLDLCLQWSKITVSKGSYQFSEAFAKELTDAKIPFQNVRGEKNMIDYLQNNKELVDYGLASFKRLFFVSE